MRRRARQADVAERAGVSPAIVSLVINGRVDGNVRISEETQRRVWEAVRELGYVANPVARKLAGNQNRLLGVFTYDTIFPIAHHNFYYPFLIGIEEEAEKQDYDLLLFTRSINREGQRRIYKDGVNSLQVADGAILLGLPQQPEELASLVQEEFPFVFVGRREVPGHDISYIHADYQTATMQVMKYVYEWGHRRIAYLGSPALIESHQDREEGYRQACKELGMVADDVIVQREALETLTPEQVQHYLDRGVTAFLAESTGYAQRLKHLLELLDKLIPHDVSLAVLSNPFYEHDSLPDATGFLIPRQEMGRMAVRTLIELLQTKNLVCIDESERVKQITLSCHFVEGKTVAEPPALHTS